MPRAELGIHGLRRWGRNWSRKVRETRSSSSQKRSEPAAHPCRGPGGQAGDDHGGSPCFKGGVEPGRAPAGVGRQLLRLCVDERVRSLFHRRCGSVQAEIDRSSRHDARGRCGRAGQETTAQTSLYKTDSSPVLNGRPVQISRGFAVFATRHLRSARLSRAPCRRPEVGFVFLLVSALVRHKSQYVND